MKRKNIATLVIAMLMCAGSALASAQPGGNGSNCRSNLEMQHSIEKALSKSGFKHLRTAESFPCITVSPNILFAIARRWTDPVYRRTYFRVRCIPSMACLPFLVSVNDDVVGEESTKVAETDPRSSRTAADDSELKNLKPSEARELAEVMPGQVITMIWEQNGMRLSRKVVCLDRGAHGEQVRARPQGSSQILKGRVIGPGVIQTLS